METEERRSYELAVMLANEADEPKVAEILSSAGGEVEILHKEGPRVVELSYPINKHQTATMYVYQFAASDQRVGEIRQRLDKESWLLRSLLITPPIKVSRRQQRPVEPRPSTAEAKPTAPAVSNEALEEALEKILE